MTGSSSSPPPTGEATRRRAIPRPDTTRPAAADDRPRRATRSRTTTGSRPIVYNDMHTALNTTSLTTGSPTPPAATRSRSRSATTSCRRSCRQIEASQAFKDNGEIVIWNDETEGDQTRDRPPASTSMEIIISPLAKGNAYTNDILYTHSSDLAHAAEYLPRLRPGRLSRRRRRRDDCWPTSTKQALSRPPFRNRALGR